MNDEFFGALRARFQYWFLIQFFSCSIQTKINLLNGKWDEFFLWRKRIRDLYWEGVFFNFVGSFYPFASNLKGKISCNSFFLSSENSYKSSQLSWTSIQNFWSKTNFISVNTLLLSVSFFLFLRLHTITRSLCMKHEMECKYICFES